MASIILLKWHSLGHLSKQVVTSIQIIMLELGKPTYNCTLPFNSNFQEWLTWNFSLDYPYIIQQTGNENIQTYQVEVVILI